MPALVKALIALAFGAALTGCVVTPLAPRPYARVGVVVPAPVVVVHGGYWVR
jgi:hypothetical protein